MKIGPLLKTSLLVPHRLVMERYGQDIEKAYRCWLDDLYSNGSLSSWVSDTVGMCVGEYLDLQHALDCIEWIERAHFGWSQFEQSRCDSNKSGTAIKP